MTALQGKRAVVVGGSSGVGKATVYALLAAGASVTAIARGGAGLRTLQASAKQGRLETMQGDATEPALAARVVRELRPDVLVMALGVTPSMGEVDELDWEAFSEAWNVDLRASFEFTKQALAAPLAPGSSVLLLSSGAAIAGSPLSGGYAGAKRMQWLLANYAQRVSDAKNLGIRTLAVVPKQLIEGTTIAERASTFYGRVNGTSAEAYMKRFAVPLDADKVAAAIVTAAGGGVSAGVNAIAVTGAGIEPLT
ncbi:MAG TPA: SDR family NAD(P)-dependent oxidoreductase [Polyangiaceae bacterium]|nr:SDR family NAD(P)-dependent oxidoreductase [Polyangiaceae bacterium]